MTDAWMAVAALTALWLLMSCAVVRGMGARLGAW